MSPTHATSWSEYFNRAPFDPVRDIEYDEPDSTSINHGRFHTMTGCTARNFMTPCDLDLFATLTMVTRRFELDYGIYHSCTLDSLGHAIGHETAEMSGGCYKVDGQLAPFIAEWTSAGYEVIVTADHGQDPQGHHGGRGEDQQDAALYYFGPARGPDPETVLELTQIAPTVLGRLGVPVPNGMTSDTFLAAT